MDRKRQDVRRAEPGEVSIDSLRLPSRVGEDGAVGHRDDLAMRGHERERRRLHAGAEAQHAEPDHVRLGRARGDGGREEVQHHATSLAASAMSEPGLLSACGRKPRM
jgi:hypothetical protein